MSGAPILLAMVEESLRGMEALDEGLSGHQIIKVSEQPADKVFHGVRYAMVWKPDRQLFTRLPNLEVLFSIGAGVDHIFRAEFVPDVPIVRFVDHTLTTRMSEWVCLQCLMHLRQQRFYDARQRQCDWHEFTQPQAGEITVGIMGLGVLGQDAAGKLKTLGFDVIGWSRTDKDIEGLETFSQAGLDAFLARTDFLVGLLPLTKETTGMFNRDVFSKLHRNGEIASPVFINAGRGGSQVETDIVTCLEDGTLGGVSLDVFEAEPLPADSPLWGFENAILTPHVAAVSDMGAFGRYVARQIDRHVSGQPLENVVDRSLGY